MHLGHGLGVVPVWDRKIRLAAFPVVPDIQENNFGSHVTICKSQNHKTFSTSSGYSQLAPTDTRCEQPGYYRRVWFLSEISEQHK
jgi:hypothetical protein